MQKFENELIVEFVFYMYDNTWVVRNPAFGVHGHTRLKPACSATETS